MPFCSEPADVSALSCSVPKNKKRRQLAAGPQPAKISGKAEVTSGKHYDVIDVHSTRMRLFSYDQLTNTGGGTFFTVGGAWESAGKGKVGISPWKLEYEPTMSRKSELNSLIPILVELILATAVHFLVWHSHCTGAKFTVLVSCRDELLTVHSCPLLWLQRQIAKLGKEFSIIDLYCVTITWQQIFKRSLQVAAIGILPPVTVEHWHLGW